MPIRTEDLPPSNACLVRLERAGRRILAIWSEGRLEQLRLGLDELMQLSAAEIRSELEHTTGLIDQDECELLAPAESQEVWAAGVTYMRSRIARMEESSGLTSTPRCTRP